MMSEKTKSRKILRAILRAAVVVAVGVAVSIFVAGCDSNAGTGALVGAAVGAGAGQAVGRDTKSTAIGAGIGAGAGYIIGSQSDKSKSKKQSYSGGSADSQIEETVWITNSNGSQTPVVLRRDGSRYIGPKGEIYNTKPGAEELKAAYGF